MTERETETNIEMERDRLRGDREGEGEYNLHTGGCGRLVSRETLHKLGCSPPNILHQHDHMHTHTQ